MTQHAFHVVYHSFPEKGENIRANISGILAVAPMTVKILHCHLSLVTVWIFYSHRYFVHNMLHTE
jgi:molybdenum cofactor biosynthesis enzyme